VSIEELFYDIILNIYTDVFIFWCLVIILQPK